VTIAAAGSFCDANVDSSGHASCSVTITDDPGRYTAIAAYAGDAAYAGGSQTVDFVVRHIPTKVTYSGDTSGDYNDLVNLSATLYKLNRFDAAAAHAREALALDPRNGDALVNLALAQKALGQQGEAQGSLRRALELNPRSAAAHYNLARQYEDAGEAARALEHYRQFLQYAGPEQSDYALDVRQRMQGLQARIKS
jgi:tetratricopeptide (TPR) repeat protein